MFTEEAEDSLTNKTITSLEQIGQVKFMMAWVQSQVLATPSNI